jgi:hypothetical protein
MPWSKPLPTPIMLIDGRVVETLLDARNLICEEDLNQHPSARRALKLLLEASETGDPVDIQVAANHVAVVLGERKLLARRCGNRPPGPWRSSIG